MGTTVGLPVTANSAAEGATGNLSAQQLDLIQGIMDEIIPAGDGMPAASAVGGADYISRVIVEHPPLEQVCKGGVMLISEISEQKFGKSFLRLPTSDRVAVLKELEVSSGRTFGALRDLVYEAYYTQPRVWKLLGYEMHPLSSHGARVKPFDERVLDQVRKKPKLYREAD